jgi:hypothetical protein
VGSSEAGQNRARELKSPVNNVFVLLSLLCIAPLSAQTVPHCSAEIRLTDDEAEILLYVSPAAISVRRAGTDVDIERSRPTPQYPASDFFGATLVSRNPTAAGVLGNGVLGTFTVDKRTGEVKSTGDFTPISGKELDRVRAWLVHAHCPTK